MSQVSKANECILQSTPPPLPAPDVMPEKETCEFQFQMFESWIGGQCDILLFEFSITFMFIPIYLRSEGDVTPPPQIFKG